MIQEINEWMCDQNFYHGVTILEKYQPDHEILSRLTGQANPTKRLQLMTAMNDLKMTFKQVKGFGALPGQVISQQPEINVVKTFAQLQQDLKEATADPNEWPPEVVEAWKQRRSLANERDKMANQLGKAPTTEARKMLYAKIKQCHMAIQPLTDLIETFKRTGEVVGKPRPTQTKKKEEINPGLSKTEQDALMADLKNARARRSKARAKIKGFEKRDMSAELKSIKISEYQLKVEKENKAIEGIELKLYGG